MALLEVDARDRDDEVSVFVEDAAQPSFAIGEDTVVDRWRRGVVISRLQTSVAVVVYYVPVPSTFCAIAQAKKATREMRVLANCIGKYECKSWCISVQQYTFYTCRRAGLSRR